MNIRTLIALSLLPTGLTGCGFTESSGDCSADSRDFSVTDADVSAADVFGSWDVQSGAEPADAQCEQVCANVVYDDDLPNATVRECTMDLDAAALAGAEGADTADTGAVSTVVGAITCSGVMVEYYCLGRRPLGHVEVAGVGIGAGPAELGPYLAQAAHFERAAVTAFDQLALQLTAWGAPEHLIERCRAARQDEALHAASVGALARAEGCTPPPAQVEAVAETLLAVAMHNATEGCVVETWAALEAHLVAGRATRADLRQVYAEIAQDETRHAQLAWDLQAWLLAGLSDADRVVVLNAQREAVAGLAATALARLEQLPVEFGVQELRGAAELVESFTAGLAA